MKFCSRDDKKLDFFLLAISSPDNNVFSLLKDCGLTFD